MMKNFFGFAFLAAMLATSQAANAATITLGLLGDSGDDDSYTIGEVFTRADFDQSGGQGAVDTQAVTGLLAAPAGYSGTNPEYFRTSNSFSPLPTPTSVGANLGPSSFSGTGNIQIVTTGYAYLVVSYDGGNGGSTVYYIGGITSGTTLEVARTAEPSGNGTPNFGHLYSSNQYGITHWTMLNPITGDDDGGDGGGGGDDGGGVPDGGMTMSLLGLGLAGMGVVSRMMKK